METNSSFLNLAHLIKLALFNKMMSWVGVIAIRIYVVHKSKDTKEYTVKKTSLSLTSDFSLWFLDLSYSVPFLVVTSVTPPPCFFQTQSTLTPMNRDIVSTHPHPIPPARFLIFYNFFPFLLLQYGSTVYTLLDVCLYPSKNSSWG